MSRRRRVNPALFITMDTSDSSIAVGDIVSLDSGANNSVVRADASDETKMPVLGIAKSVRSGSVVVQRDYLYTFPTSYAITVSTGQSLWADPSNPGKVTTTLPTTGLVQRVGYGKKSNKTMIITIEPIIIEH